MAQKAADRVPLVEPGRLVLPYTYYAGPVATKFYREIKDNKKIMGMKCPRCNIVYIPPRGTCGRCNSDISEWVEVGKKGTVQSFTLTQYPLKIQPQQPPIIYALIQLDGADTALPHIINEVDPSNVCIGMRVEAVFKGECKGNILDIKYFKPIK